MPLNTTWASQWSCWGQEPSSHTHLQLVASATARIKSKAERMRGRQWVVQYRRPTAFWLWSLNSPRPPDLHFPNLPNSPRSLREHITLPGQFPLRSCHLRAQGAFFSSLDVGYLGILWDSSTVLCFLIILNFVISTQRKLSRDFCC